MKSATIFLLAVTAFTLFLESSTAPADSTASETSLDLEVAVGNEQTQQQARTSLSGIIKSLLVSGAISKVTNKIETLISNVGAIVKAINDKGDAEEDITINIDESDKQEIFKLMAESEDALTRAIKLISDALTKAKGEDKKPLTQVLDWLHSLEALRDTVYPNIRAAIASGSVKDIVNVLAELSAAIEQTEEDAAKYSKILPNGPVRAGFDKELRTLVVKAKGHRDALQAQLVVPL